ncbi:MAG: DUF3330 domain-containing protein [Gammaproteobacteria bacterium]|nr:DUF3330 domain-containing protein [Gammaproteobacteria bacterium]
MEQQAEKVLQTEGTVECEVCLTEIPESGAKNAEAKDYVRHFCGLECYQKWEQNKTQIESK